jgi:CelD/BcsL family acetyltransferase involved in cellulose biosynthesis
VAGQVNPLALLPGVSACELTGNVIALAGSWPDYHQALDRRVRMEFERSWRVFQREPTARFHRVLDHAGAQAAIAFLDDQQRARMTALGQPFMLDTAERAAFYNHNLSDRLAKGQIVITALEARSGLVAVLYGISDGHTLVLLRVANVGGVWANVSPSRLLVHRTLEHAFTSGLTTVDLSVGDYDYKRRLGPVPVALFDLVTALSWRGQTQAVKNKAVAHLRKFPELDARLRRLLGRHRAGRTPPVNTVS